ncbi:MAG: 3-hydroxyisobutyryl- hydrolase [Lasallia pustulata]|uniref:3-hydroxyisobutyryl-CoA hydrolase n=1 Tax=Lasallia pustulata TaxID=136370 RepID=A0A5M8PHL1_9LECA|nr:MAG: 3-hydroxyisobutyryl- hydrolase [Lasallia pustulata]
MPLKARILNPAIAGQAKMSTAVPIPREEPGDDPDDVLFNTLYGVRTIELNRPEKLNSLNGSMCRKIIPRLKEWEKSQLANVIIMAGTGPKAFCAGGDVAALAQLISKEGARGIQKSKDYFALEYRLDHLNATYSKPYIAYMDGITMGGGCGLSMHAPLRIATERTLFAMPETSIGFFPDVGASFFLPRLDGHTGTYLALTSSRLHGVNAFYAGIATHYIDSSSLGALTARLAELPALFAGPLRQAIDRCFHHHALEDILAALRREEQSAGATAAWAAQTRRALAERSPTSLKVALRAMRVAARWSIAETFQREWALAGKMVEHPDFVEGWRRAGGEAGAGADVDAGSVEEVGVEEVDRFFRVEGGRKLELLEGGMDYSEYPFAGLGLPAEGRWRGWLGRGEGEGGGGGGFVRARRGKVGVREKVEEVLGRM